MTDNQVWTTRIETVLYVGVPHAYFYEQLVYQHNAVGQNQIDTSLDEFETALEENERSCFTDTFEEMLYNASNLGLLCIIVYPL